MDNNDETTTEPECRAERWAYAGVRLFSGKLYDEWREVREGGELGGPLHYAHKRGQYASVGGVYEARVSTDGDKTIRHGFPTWHGDRLGDADQVREWSALDRVARTRHAADRAHANEVKRDELDEALAPLVAIAARLRTSVDREAFLATVIRRVTHPW